MFIDVAWILVALLVGGAVGITYGYKKGQQKGK